MLYAHDYAIHDSNTVIKFSDDTTVVGLISNNNKAQREDPGAGGLVQWQLELQLYLSTPF